jgi:hypothetical protein
MERLTSTQYRGICEDGRQDRSDTRKQTKKQAKKCWQLREH